ncbi:MAG TPA: hypothetical protein VKH34_16370 [Vicinamibacterales bacterium]|nr:hypothetical protein [Vicinamibacterales bacterium]
MPTVPLRSKRRERAQAVQKFQHAIPAAPLLFAGLQAIRGGAHGLELALAIFEIATSALLLGTVAREVRTLRRPAEHSAHASHHGVDWVHIFAACVLVAEVLEHYHLTHHIRRPTVVTALVTLALGLFHGRLQRLHERRRVLRVEDEGIHVGGRFFQSFRAKWEHIASIDLGDRHASIKTHDGRERKLNLADLHGADEVRAVLADAQSRAAAARTD